MKLLFLIILLLINYVLLGQNYPKIKFEKKIEIIEGDSIEAEGYVIHGKKYGHWYYHYLNGNLFKRNFYSIDTNLFPYVKELILKDLMYYNLDVIVLSYEGKMRSIDSTNKFVIVSNDDPLVEYYPEGKIHKEINYDLNKYYYFTYSKKGTIEVKSEILNGEIKGRFWEYFENGKVKAEGSIDEKGLQGFYITYNMNGSIENQTYYKNGYPLK